MNRPPECPKCFSRDLYESCYSTFPFRMTFCRCGWDNLVEVIRSERAACLKNLLALPEYKLTDEDRRCIKGLQDPETEAQLIASLRG